jgi:ketosteroid isomerase-like protein
VHPDDLAAVRAWFDSLSKHCRAVDYEAARPIFADDMIAFGTFTDFMHGRELAEQKQWRNVWGTIRNFRYDLDKIEAIVSGDRLTAVGMAVWQSDGFHPNGDPSGRPGLTTGDVAPQVGRRTVRRHPHPHVAVPRHARPELRAGSAEPGRLH